MTGRTRNLAFRPANPHLPLSGLELDEIAEEPG